jgi:hypothetical protein
VNPTQIAIAAAFLTATAAPAFAAVGDGAFDAFKQACGDTNADYAAVVAASSGEGWKTADIAAPAMPKVTLSDQMSRTKIAAGDEVTLIAAQGNTANAIHVSICTVYGPPAAMAEFRSRAAQWLGFGPHDSDDKTTTFHFSNDGGKLSNVADSGTEAAAAGPGLDVLSVKTDSGKSILDLIKIKH